jgi:hypothetical protein
VRQQNDLGGLPAGDLEIIDEDAAPWAKMLTAIHGAIGSRGHYNIDMMRRSMESLPPEKYNLPYYERWMAGILILLEETNLLTRAEIDERMEKIKAGLEAKK